MLFAITELLYEVRNFTYCTLFHLLAALTT